MSLLNSLLQDDATLERAPHAYLPLPDTAPADMAYAHWTRKLASQHALGVARELAGLPEPRLAELAGEFARVPQRQRTDKLRLSFRVAAALLLAGAIALVFEASLRAAGHTGISVLQGLAIGCLAGGAGAVSFGVLAAFVMKPLEVAHSKLGRCLGLLDEQHPWLYDASLVMRNPAADAYRQRILQERGPLRGIDYLMMGEIARVNDALDMTHVARSVAARLNTIDTPNDAGAVREPRLATVAASSAFFARAARAGGKDTHLTSIRSFESTGVDRRRPT
jgi:hypothetical protein